MTDNIDERNKKHGARELYKASCELLVALRDYFLAENANTQKPELLQAALALSKSVEGINQWGKRPVTDKNRDHVIALYITMDDRYRAVLVEMKRANVLLS